MVDVEGEGLVVGVDVDGDFWFIFVFAAFGLWGSLIPVINTTGRAPEMGVHVHAREDRQKPKIVDGTFHSVLLTIAGTQHTIEGDAAMAQVLSRLTGHSIEAMGCPHCGQSHVDEAEFAITPHSRHQCMACGRYFGQTPSIGNPLAHLTTFAARQTVIAPRRIDLNSSDYPGGIQVWASNPALVWTSSRPEESGVHVHCYKHASDEYGSEAIDQTFGEVTIDGQRIDSDQLRIYMVQQHLPSLVGRIESVDCEHCLEPIFEKDGHVARTDHECSSCNKTTNTRRKVVSNPIVTVIAALSNPRPASRTAVGKAAMLMA